MRNTILLIDDDLISLTLMSDQLQHAGYTLLTAENGKIAWELLQQQPEQFMLVISDRIMPGLHGLQLLEKMHNHPQLNNVPMILLTGHLDDDEMLEVKQAAIFDLLMKPVEQKLLLQAVKQALQQ